MIDGTKKQLLLLSYVLGNEDVFSVCRSIMEPGFFDKEVAPAVEFAMSHADKYSSVPSFDMIEAETGVVIPVEPDVTDPRRVDWACDEIEKFCRTKKVIDAVYEAADKISKGELDGLVDPIREAVLLGLHRDIGTDYFENPKARLSRMLENHNFPTGFSRLDDILFGGVERGGVNLVLAGSGVGKSFFLANQALNFMEKKLNVLYVTLELSEDFVCKRFDSMVTGIASRNIFNSIDDTSFKVKHASSKHGFLRVKYLPPNSTMADVESFYRELLIQTGQHFDVLMLDYLDLLAPKAKVSDMGNLWVKDKYVSEELRAFSSEHKLFCFTASQMTRGAMDEDDHKQSMVAGGISKINTVDNVMSLFQSSELRERCKYLIQLLKTRSSAGVGKRFTIQYDPDTMRMSDDTDEPEVGSDEKIKKPRPVASANLDRINRIIKKVNS